MVIPKGKKFQFRVTEYGRKGRLLNKAITQLNNLIENDSSNKRKFKAVENQLNIVSDNFVVPAYGFMGNSYIGQDINISVNANFSKPLEGILNMIPSTVDLLYQASQGVSLKNARFTHMKYWTGTESPEISLNLIFETQIDSYYDVYLPVMNLMRLALPAEMKSGFYQSPSPSLKFIAAQAPKFIKALGGELTAPGVDEPPAITKAREGASGAYENVVGITNDLVGSVEEVGFKTSLYVGNNFEFKNIIVKNVSPTFSSELAYAPIHWINNKIPGYNFNPYTKGEALTKAYAQTICAMVASGNNVFQMGVSFLKMMPAPVRNWIESKKIDLPSFPIKAEVNMTLELQFPLVRNLNKEVKSSIKSVFSDEGFFSTFNNKYT